MLLIALVAGVWVIALILGIVFRSQIKEFLLTGVSVVSGVIAIILLIAVLIGPLGILGWALYSSYRESGLSLREYLSAAAALLFVGVLLGGGAVCYQIAKESKEEEPW